MLQSTTDQPRRRSVESAGENAGFDPITGVAARALFRGRVEQDWQRAEHQQQRVSVIMFCIDRFRECGSATAPDCLQAVADVIQTHCRRRADFVGRMRDHEFAILLSGATRQGARQLADTICKAVAALQFKPAGVDWTMTLSGGVACMVPRPSRFADSLLIAADAGMREARRQGGNRVCISSKLR